MQLPLQVIFVIVDDSLIGDGNEDLLSFRIGEIVDPVIDVIVESQRPLQFQRTGLGEIVLLGLVFGHC